MDFRFPAVASYEMTPQSPDVIALWSSQPQPRHRVVGDCRVLEMQCCPKEPVRKVPRSIYEEAREVAQAHGKTKAYAQSQKS
jgi:hypothetical protein